MADMGWHIIDFLKWLEEKKNHAITIVECGTIRNPSFTDHEDGLATYHIAKWLAYEAKHKHDFFSFELNVGILRESKAFLKKQMGLDEYVTFGLGDADLLLQHFNRPIDFCYLDAGASPVENLSQYRRAEAWMDQPGLILIDDVFDIRNANRGLVTVPYARLEGRRVAEIAGRQALISFGADEVPLPEGGKWL